MQVFKTYFKLLNYYKGVVALYLVIFLLVSIVVANNRSGGSANEQFSSDQLKLAVVVRDGKTFRTALEQYFQNQHQFLEVEDDEEAILNELYWRMIDYVLVIPEGYEEKLIAGEEKNTELQCMKVPGRYENSYFETELKQYTGRLSALLRCGYSLEEAENTLASLKDKRASVELASFVNANQNDKATVFFGMVPYLAFSLGIIGVGTILLQFNKQELKDRTECSAMPLRLKAGGLTAAILVYGILLFVTVMGIATVLSEGSILSDVRCPLFAINVAAMLLLGLSLGFLTGSVVKNADTVNGIVNIVGLGLCFLGGVFVPLEFFSERIIRVARWLPSYWYVINNQTIGEMKDLSPALFRQIFSQMGVVLGYALAIFAMTLVIMSVKRKRKA